MERSPFFPFLFLIIFLCNSLNAMHRLHSRYPDDRMFLPPGAYDQLMSLEKYKAISAEIETLVKKRNSYSLYLAGGDQTDLTEDQKKQFKEYGLLGGDYIQREYDRLRSFSENGIFHEGLIERLEKQANSLLEVSESKMGELIARGIAGGTTWGGKVDSIAGGVWQGLTCRLAKDFGNVLSKNVSGALEDVIGRSFGFMVSKGFRCWEYLYNDIFHDGYEGFEIKSIQAWEALIKDVFSDIEKMLKEGMKDSLRGRDVTLRPFEVSEDNNDADDDLSDVNKDESGQDAALAQIEEIINPWRILVAFYTSIFDRLIVEIDQRKLYYEKLSMEVFYAEQIKLLLDRFKKILEKTDSLAAFESALKSNKAILSAIKSGVGNIFKRLVEEVKPKNYSMNGLRGGYKSKDKFGSSFFDAEDNNDDYNRFTIED
ncbi:MAG: hypothetical protein V1855_02880 [bacterium]